MKTKEFNLSEKVLKLQIELEKIRIKKIELSSKCRIKELLIKKEIAKIYRSKKHQNKVNKELKKLIEDERK